MLPFVGWLFLVGALVALPELALAAQRASIEIAPKAHIGGPALWVFLVLAGGALGLALLTITRKNAVTAVVSLMGSFVCLAGIYVLLYAHFLAVMQVLVYAGAILVLFVFVIMMLGREDRKPWSAAPVLAKAVGVLTLVFLLFLVLRISPAGSLLGITGAPDMAFGGVGAMGDVLFRDYLFPFEAVSLLLLVAAVGAIVVGSGHWRPTSRQQAVTPTPPLGEETGRHEAAPAAQREEGNP